MGLDGSTYVLGMPRRGYLPFFATLNPQITCHGARPGPTVAPWCSGGAPCVPRSQEHEKRPVARRGRNADVQKKTFIHDNIIRPFLCLDLRPGTNEEILSENII